MINLGSETKLTPQQILERAIAYFGKGGLGLEMREDAPGCLTFSGGGGYVSVTVTTSQERKTEVSVVAQEWEQDAKSFLAKIH